jgi:hypothetical protein
VLGEECHIVGRGAGAARAGEIDAAELDSFENLILLCGTHHKLVDDQPMKYASERLRTLKRDHEQWVARSLEPPDGPPRVRIVVPTNKAVELELVTSGARVLRLMHRTKMYSFSGPEPEPTTVEEVELVADFFQNVADWGDIYDDIGPGEQVRAGFTMTEQIGELLMAGLAVYIGEYPSTLQVDAMTEAFPTAVVQLVRVPDKRRHVDEGEAGEGSPESPISS